MFRDNKEITLRLPPLLKRAPWCCLSVFRGCIGDRKRCSFPMLTAADTSTSDTIQYLITKAFGVAYRCISISISSWMNHRKLREFFLRALDVVAVAL